MLWLNCCLVLRSAQGMRALACWNHFMPFCIPKPHLSLQNNTVV